VGSIKGDRKFLMLLDTTMRIIQILWSKSNFREEKRSKFIFIRLWTPIFWQFPKKEKNSFKKFCSVIMFCLNFQQGSRKLSLNISSIWKSLREKTPISKLYFSHSVGLSEVSKLNFKNHGYNQENYLCDRWPLTITIFLRLTVFTGLKSTVSFFPNLKRSKYTTIWPKWIMMIFQENLDRFHLWLFCLLKIRLINLPVRQSQGKKLMKYTIKVLWEILYIKKIMKSGFLIKIHSSVNFCNKRTWHGIVFLKKFGCILRRKVCLQICAWWTF